MLAGSLQVGCRTATPRDDGHARALRKLLGGDLVTQPSDHIAGRTDEHDAEALTHGREVCVLRDEAPADPDRVGPRFDERPLQDVVVEVRQPLQTGSRITHHRRSEADRLVGFAHEPRVPVGLGVEGDGPDGRAMLDVELRYRVEQPHG